MNCRGSTSRLWARASRMRHQARTGLRPRRTRQPSAFFSRAQRNAKSMRMRILAASAYALPSRTWVMVQASVDQNKTTERAKTLYFPPVFRELEPIFPPLAACTCLIRVLQPIREGVPEPAPRPARPPHATNYVDLARIPIPRDRVVGPSDNPSVLTCSHSFICCGYTRRARMVVQ